MMSLSAAFEAVHKLPRRETIEEYRTRKNRENIELRGEMDRRNRERRLEILRRDCELGDRFASRTFETWKQSPATSAAEDAARAVSGNPRLGLWLHGAVGSGKTHLVAAIVNTSLDQCVPAVFTTSVKLLERLRSSYDRDRTAGENERDIISKYVAVDILVIDDLGKERFSAWSSERIYQLVNDRYEANRPVIVTSNLAPDQLVDHWKGHDIDPFIGEALVRRLAEMAGTIVGT